MPSLDRPGEESEGTYVLTLAVEKADVLVKLTSCSTPLPQQPPLTASAPDGLLAIRSLSQELTDEVRISHKGERQQVKGS